jgi:hypothetical protein
MNKVCRKEDEVSLNYFDDPYNTVFWSYDGNKSTYYDRKYDLQGSVPGPTAEEAEELFNRECRMIHS